MAHPNFGKYADALLTLVNADPETERRMLRFDPSRSTPEQFADNNYQRIIAKPAVNSDDTPPPAFSISRTAAALADFSRYCGRARAAPRPVPKVGR